MALKLSRPRLELLYSLFLIVLIPLAIAAGTVLLTSQVKADFDQELRRKANLANEVFGVSASTILAGGSPAQSAAQLQTLIDQTRRAAPEIAQLSVIVPTGGQYQTVASSDQTKLTVPDSSIQTQLAWSKNQPVASLIAAGEAQARQWQVTTPIANTAGTTVALASMRVSLAASDELIGATLRSALIVLAIMLSVIVALLVHHFRFVQYAELFRQQKELDQMKDDFISIATHELKAPMSVIKGYISMALEENTLTKNVRDMLQTGFDQTERLGRLVNDLLDVSRIEQGRTKYNLTSFALPGTIGPLVTTYQPKAQAKGLTLTYQPPADLPNVMADIDRVGEIFTNLVDNAIKYSRTGAVKVEHTVTPEGIITTVSDTGIGMTPEEVAHLFQRFYRVRNSDTQDISGTGLGLWIIKQYAEHMGGSIRVESVKGQGTKFIVTLPKAAV